METERSATCTIYPIVAALDKADDVIGQGRVWNAVNETQGTFLSIFNEIRGEARTLKDIESVASRSAEEINSFLAKRGFQIALQPFKHPKDFGTASVLDVLVEWLKEGQITEIVSGRDHKTIFPGVILEDGVSFAKSKHHQNPIAVLQTKSGDTICVTVHDRLEGFALLDRVNILRKSMAPVGGFDGLHFPQVSLDQKVDIGWLKNAWTHSDVPGDDYKVAEALQQTKFRMNEKGARVESAVAIGFAYITCIMPPTPPLIIDKPFLVWLERSGLKQPLFTGWISEENWSKPKDIYEK